MKQDVDARDKRGHDDKFQSSPFRDAPLGAGQNPPAAMCCPHPEERALRARLEGWQQGVHAAILRRRGGVFHRAALRADPLAAPQDEGGA